MKRGREGRTGGRIGVKQRDKMKTGEGGGRREGERGGEKIEEGFSV